MKKILITGGSGLIGANLAKVSLGRFEVYATYKDNPVGIRGVEYFRADLTKEKTADTIYRIGPDYIVHCAALTDLDYCQRNPLDTYQHNVITSENIARTAKNLKAHLMHISTDSVFDGEKGGYREEDKPNSVNVYARTKLESERRVASILPHASIVRTNIYGWNIREKLSLAEWMLNKLRNKESFGGLKDVYFSPIFVNDLTDVFFKLQDIRHSGLIHVAASRGCSKLDFAYKIAEVFSLDKKLIKPALLADIGLFAPRPRNTVLDVRRCQSLLGIRLPGIEEGLNKMKALEDNGYLEELKSGR